MARLGKYLSLYLAPILVISSLLIIEAAKAESERVTTTCVMFVDNIVEWQPVKAIIQMYPATPTGEGYTQLIVYLVSPNGVGESGPNGPWVYTNISTDPNGRATVTFDVPTYSGSWQVVVDFGSHYYADYSMLYLAGTWKTVFTVYPAKTPTPSPTTLVTPSPAITTPSSTLPNIGPTSPPNSNFDLTVTLALVVVAILVIAVLSLLVYVRHLKRNLPKPDNSTP